MGHIHAWRWGLVIAATWVASACGDSGGGGSGKCTTGKVEACPCSNGGTGTQTCLPNGTFAECKCTVADGGADADSSADAADSEPPDATVDALPDADADAQPTDAAPDGVGDAADASGSGCSALPATCGASASESCCTTLSVPGGTFNRSNDATYPATVSSFKLDKFEISVGRFRAFVNEGFGTQAAAPQASAGAHPKVANSGWNASWNASLPPDASTFKAQLKCTTPSGSATWTDTPGGNEGKPINCITWYEAFAFCVWDGGRLPTEAEWNYAAAGGNEQRTYPWGSTAPTASLAVFGNAPLAAVGSKSPSGDAKWGQSDLAGSVWEWNFDLNSAYPMPCADCANTTTGSERGLRGGAWYDVATIVTTVRHGQVPTFRDTGVGARCARDS